MARLSRETIYEASNCFHVLVQGIAKSYIFDMDLNKGYYLKLMSDKRKEYGISLLSFCIMGNHAHILVYAEEKNKISKFFKDVNLTYAMFYNRENKRVGFVFRNRFKTEPIVNEEYLVDCISYIHNNPIKARLVETAEEYNYSSAKNYTTRRGIVDFQALEKLLGHIPTTRETKKEFIEDEYEGKMEQDEAIEMVRAKLGIKNIKSLENEEGLLIEFVKEVQKTTKISLREFARILEINRERLRKIMK